MNTSGFLSLAVRVCCKAERHSPSRSFDVEICLALSPEHTWDWRWGHGRWISGPSWIEPFENPALESLAYTEGNRTLITVRECLRGTPKIPAPTTRKVGTQAYDAARDEALAWPLEHLTIEATGSGRFFLHAGAWGTAPVYLLTNGDVIRGSWDLTDLRTFLSDRFIDEVSIARYLSRMHRYSYRTFFTNVLRLTERAKATFDAEGIRVYYPEPAAHVMPRDIRPGADVIGAYETILAASMRRWRLPWSRTAVEVSGGFDSADILVTAASMDVRDISTYGLLIGGSPGAQQERRRTELLGKGTFRDVAIRAQDWPPFCADGRRGKGYAFDPGVEPYSEALDAALERVTANETSVVVTGVGGDELMSLRPWERGQRRRYAETAGSVQGKRFFTRRTYDTLNSAVGADPDVPATILTGPSLLAAASRTPVFLRNGCWPISPLCTPELMRFCEWLPVDWRRNRRLQRSRLKRAGLSHEWLYPHLQENFAHVMQIGLRHYGVPLLAAMMRDSLLAELDFVDPGCRRPRA